MTKKRTDSSSKRKTRKLGVKKETLKDLSATRGKGPKGGALYVTALCRGGPTLFECQVGGQSLVGCCPQTAGH